MDKYSGQYMASHMMLELWLKIKPGEGIRHASGVGVGCSVLYRVVQEGLTEAVRKRVMWTWKGKALQGKGRANTKTLSTWEQKHRLYVFLNPSVSICKYLAPCCHSKKSSPPPHTFLSLSLCFSPNTHTHTPYI